MSTAQYKSLLKHFAVRLCIAVTLCVVLLVAGEIYSYRRYLPAASDVMELAAKLSSPRKQPPPNANTGKNSRKPTKSRITSGSSGAESLIRAR